ncbi:hypothetical protein BC629DRAFT_58364 [Irpex lacteus]|nr:hypothetical protein BC629DRAFT_58364 [Irpex lacteus]
MSQTQDVLALLREQFALTEGELADDDISVALSTLVIGATKDDEPRHTLQSIHQATLTHDIVPEIDVFTVVPLLLESAQEASDELLDSIAKQCSAKEMVIVLQDFSERFMRSTGDDEESGDDRDEDDEEAANEDVRTQRASKAKQVIRIVTLYSEVIPRLSRGKKTPSQILDPPLTQLQEVLGAATPVLTENDVDQTLRSLDKLILAIGNWAGDDKDVKDKLYSFTMAALQAFDKKLGTGVAQRAFEEQFPRLRRPPGSTNPSSQAATTSTDPVAELSNTLQSLGIEPIRIRPGAPLATLVFIAHNSTPLPLDAFLTLSSLIPVSLLTNTFLPSTLSLLLRTLGPLASPSTATIPSSSPTSGDKDRLSGTLTALTAILPQIASHHPDPLLRHITFRLLSLVLTLTPPNDRIYVLRDLVAPPDVYDEGSESMAVASVGLVKESVLAALSSFGGDQTEEENVFATATFTDVFIPVLFTPRFPPSSSASTLREGDGGEEEDVEEELEAFLSSSEPSRLVEVLGLYYLLIRRDTENRTGICAPDNTEKIKTTLRDVLRGKLRQWDRIDLEEAEDAKMQLGILDMWLDRIAEALAAR